MKAKASTYFTCLLPVHRFVYFYFNLKDEDFLFSFCYCCSLNLTFSVFTMLLNGDDDADQHES